MDLDNLFSSLVIGAVAGWLAGLMSRGKGFGCFGNIVVGVIGAVLGGFVFSLVGLTAHGFIGNVICAFIGALVLLWVASLLKK